MNCYETVAHLLSVCILTVQTCLVEHGMVTYLEGKKSRNHYNSISTQNYSSDMHVDTSAQGHCATHLSFISLVDLECCCQRLNVKYQDDE